MTLYSWNTITTVNSQSAQTQWSITIHATRLKIQSMGSFISGTSRPQTVLRALDWRRYSMAHNDILIDALARRIQARQLRIEHIPKPLQPIVQKQLDSKEEFDEVYK